MTFGSVGGSPTRPRSLFPPGIGCVEALLELTGADTRAHTGTPFVPTSFPPVFPPSCASNGGTMGSLGLSNQRGTSGRAVGAYPDASVVCPDSSRRPTRQRPRRNTRPSTVSACRIVGRGADADGAPLRWQTAGDQGDPCRNGRRAACHSVTCGNARTRLARSSRVARRSLHAIAQAAVFELRSVSTSGPAEVVPMHRVDPAERLRASADRPSRRRRARRHPAGAVLRPRLRLRDRAALAHLVEHVDLRTGAETVVMALAVVYAWYMMAWGRTGWTGSAAGALAARRADVREPADVATKTTSMNALPIVSTVSPNAMM